jgi:glutamate synthase (NADPH/NADH) large chain
VVAESCGDHGCEYMTGGRLVMLGPIGRNFGAGMSGGIAYLYDPENKAAANINREMVDLEEVTEAEEAIDLKSRIERHLEYTGSTAAQEILADWKKSLAKFVKVMPRDYKRALAEKAAEALVKG